jgi:hypothetical protein
MATTLYYRYLSPSAADHHVGKVSYSVWYYGTDVGTQNGVLCSSLSGKPSSAYAAIIATSDNSFAEGDSLFQIELADGKDPQQPPPPQLQWSKSAYLAQSNVQDYTAGLARRLSHMA